MLTLLVRRRKLLPAGYQDVDPHFGGFGDDGNGNGDDEEEV